MDKEKILGCTPWIEVFIRKIYYSNNFLGTKLKNIKSKRVETSNTHKKDILNPENKLKIMSQLKSLNIKKGDILIVHSSMDVMSCIGWDSTELINFLRQLIGEEGTLVLPAFPLYNDKNLMKEKGVYVYNPKRTLCSTGMLPNIFIRMPNVIRSHFPWNTLAAQGPHAKEMMQYNLDTDLAHGKNSAWEYCMNHHAKILLLGVKSSHTTTMVHVAEDILDDMWPIKEWYESRNFIIQDRDKEQNITIRIRKQDWARYNASWYRSYQLKKKDLLKESQICGINIGVIDDSKKLVDYIVERTLAHKPFFAVPKRCYKK